jgi:hypothetical protein
MKAHRRPIVLLLVAVGTFLAAGVAMSAAAPPTKDTFFDSFSFEDPTTCPGITIVQSNEERDTITEFSPTKVRIQRHGVATLTANGKSLTSNFSAMIFLDPSTTLVKVAGTVYNIQVPGAGNVLLDAGNIVMDVSTDPPAVVHVGGPHQQFSGDVAGLCNYLSAP